MVAQLISSVLIAALGLGFTIFAQRVEDREKHEEADRVERQSESQLALSRQQGVDQRKLSLQESRSQLRLEAARDSAEFDLENRKNVSGYLAMLAVDSRPERRVELLEHMEGALRPEEVVAIAVDYAHPPFDMLEWGASADGSKEKYKEAKSVSDTAVSVLDHVAKVGGGAKALRAISMSNTMPDREIARGVLGGPTRVWVRASQIDDFGYPIIVFTKNDWRQVSVQYRAPVLTFQQDSGWFEITRYLIAGDEGLEFVVKNGRGGCGARLEVSAGAQQYDSGPYYRDNCPLSDFGVSIHVHLKVIPNGPVQILDVEETDCERPQRPCGIDY